MRWILLLLAVLNVVLYVWAHQQQPARHDKLPAIGSYRSDTPAIRLLAELPQRPTNLGQGGATECTYLGAFSAQGPADILLQRLRSLGGEGRVVSSDVIEGVDHWVYLPPLSSRQASIRQLKELQSRGVDAYVIAVGELENGVSLGIHSDMQSAQVLVERVRGLGYQAEIKDLPRPYRVFRLSISRLPPGHTGQSLMQTFGLGEQSQHQLAAGPCE